MDRVYLTMRGFFAPDQVARLVDITRGELEEIVEEQFGFAEVRGGEPGRILNYLEMKRYLHDQLLRDTDVFGMAHSIEARVPYLDHVVVEKAWALPAKRKLDASVNKPVLVRAVDDPAVTAAATNKKRGFSFPMNRWMQSSIGELQEIAAAARLDRGTMRQCWNQFARGELHWSRAWVLTVLGAQN